MKRVLALVCSIFIFSCSGDEFAADCDTWGEFSQCRELNEIEIEVYSDVAVCMGVMDELPSPTVVIVTGQSITCGDVSSAGCQTGGFIGFSEPESDVLSAGFIWRHEFTHEILELTTGSADRLHKTHWYMTNECIN
jgi:hypothetical protein